METINRSGGVEQFGQKSFAYDANGNLTNETDWKGVATTHTYDELNRRNSTTNRLHDSMTMAYDLAGNLIQTTDFEGRLTDYQYDDLNRQTKLSSHNYRDKQPEARSSAPTTMRLTRRTT